MSLTSDTFRGRMKWSIAGGHEQSLLLSPWPLGRKAAEETPWGWGRWQEGQSGSQRYGLIAAPVTFTTVPSPQGTVSLEAIYCQDLQGAG